MIMIMGLEAALVLIHHYSMNLTHILELYGICKYLQSLQTGKL